MKKLASLGGMAWRDCPIAGEASTASEAPQIAMQYVACMD
jgi:hypothetical protein